MNAVICFHHGFEFRLDGDALAALLLSRSEGRDLRSIEALAQALPLDLLEHIPASINERIVDASPSIIQLRVDDVLKSKLDESLASVAVPVTLITENPACVDLVRRMLCREGLEPMVVTTPSSITGTSRCGLVILDGLQENWEVPSSLDSAVLAGLMDETRIGKAERQGSVLPVPIRFQKGKPPLRQRQGRAALSQALRRARFSLLFGRLRAMRIRWATHFAYDLSKDGTAVQVTLAYDGEERLLASKDLKLDLPWADIPKERFTDVFGHAASVATLRNVLTWLKDPKGRPGLQGFILDGPPGTGKSMLARALAGESGAPCFLLGASEFQAMYFGETERRIRETFSALRGYELAVVVLDEFDAIAWRRDGAFSNSAMYQASTVGQLLSSLDELRRGPGRVVLLATTNNFDKLDPALVRSMRIGERLHLGLPNSEERRNLLAARLAGLLDTLDMEEAEDLTSGFTQADLVHLVEQVLKRVEDPSCPAIGHLRRVVLEKRSGPRNTSIRLSEEGRRRVALHEAGHALVAWRLLGPDQVRHLSLVPGADGQLGAAFNRGIASTDIGRESVRNALALLLGGRVAETACYPDAGATCGCESDLKAATELAQLAVGQWGLDSSFPLISVTGLPEDLRSSLAKDVIERIRYWIKEGEERATGIILAEMDRLQALADLLLEKETLHRPEIQSVLSSTEVS